MRCHPRGAPFIHIFDARRRGGGRALEVTERDLTNGTSGFMIASGANGFMNTSPADCSGTPFNFRLEYSTAPPNNIVPWGPGAYNINTEYEVGHFEPCTRVTGPQTPTEETFTDTFWTNRLDVLDPDAGRPERRVEVLLGLVGGDRERLLGDRRPQLLPVWGERRCRTGCARAPRPGGGRAS
jgi:hypothetical protein